MDSGMGVYLSAHVSCCCVGTAVRTNAPANEYGPIMTRPILLEVWGILWSLTCYTILNAVSCTNPCQNGGICTAPDTCTCMAEWTGVECQNGKWTPEHEIWVQKLISYCCVCVGGYVHTVQLTKQVCACVHGWRDVVEFDYVFSNGNCFHIPSSLFLSNLAINCGDPGTPTSGKRNLSSTTYNSVVTYTCDVGYTLQGSNSRTCQSSGQWSGSLPQCNRMFENGAYAWYSVLHGRTS